MQEISKDLILKLASEGYNPGEIKAYLKGMHQGMETVKGVVSRSKMEIGVNETDPLYAHTWNNAIDNLDSLIEKLMQGVFSGTEEEDEQT